MKAVLVIFTVACLLGITHARCTGTRCAEGCTGGHCAHSCKGDFCGTRCVTGGQCAHSCKGSQCGFECVGAQCALGCEGYRCAAYCTGAQCANGCKGVECDLGADERFQQGQACENYNGQWGRCMFWNGNYNCKWTNGACFGQRRTTITATTRTTVTVTTVSTTSATASTTTTGITTTTTTTTSTTTVSTATATTTTLTTTSATTATTTTTTTDPTTVTTHTTRTHTTRTHTTHTHSHTAEHVHDAGDEGADDHCNNIKCALLCEDECGWSRGQNMCVAGLETSASEIAHQLGDCDEYGEGDVLAALAKINVNASALTDARGNPVASMVGNDAAASAADAGSTHKGLVAGMAILGICLLSVLVLFIVYYKNTNENGGGGIPTSAMLVKSASFKAASSSPAATNQMYMASPPSLTSAVTNQMYMASVPTVEEKTGTMNSTIYSIPMAAEEESNGGSAEPARGHENALYATYSAPSGESTYEIADPVPANEVPFGTNA